MNSLNPANEQHAQATVGYHIDEDGTDGAICDENESYQNMRGVKDMRISHSAATSTHSVRAKQTKRAYFAPDPEDFGAAARVTQNVSCRSLFSNSNPLHSPEQQPVLFRKRNRSRCRSHTPCSSYGGTSASVRLPSKEGESWKTIFVNLRTPKNILSKDIARAGAGLGEPGETQNSSNPPLPVLIDPKFQAAPLWQLLAPFSLRFRKANVEEMFAEFVQAQIAKNLWWALWVLVFCVMTEYFITVSSTQNFSPLHQPAHFLYTLGVLIIAVGGIGISILSWNNFFEPYLEACIALFGTVFAALMVFSLDHYRVASVLGFPPETVWGRTGFSDAPLLLGLNAILWAIAIFLPVRSVSLWPVCLSAIISYQFATIVCGSPDGLRPTVLNILLLIVVSYLALIGRRALEAQLRLQFIEVHRTACKIQSLENQILQYQQPATTTLEWLFNSLRDSSARIEYVQSCIEEEYPEMATILERGLKEVSTSLAHLSRIDTLLAVNLNAIIDRSGNSESNFLNDSTKLFIRSNFSRPDNGECINYENQISSKVPTENDGIIRKIHYDGIKFATITSLRDYDFEGYMFDEIGRNWNYDTIALDVKSGGRALELVGMYLLELYGRQHLNCAQEDIRKFLMEVQACYENNPYHNSAHGADVCHSALFLLSTLELFEQMDFFEQLASLIATLCHDVAHPGKNSAFLVATRHDISTTYNDQSVLEQFHASKTFQILKRAECNFTKNLKADQFKKFRHAVIDLILETDMSKHFESISKFKLLRQNPGFSIWEQSEDRWHAVRICIKAADISHSAKCWNIHFSWSLKCIEEFFLQGDEERSLGIPLSPLCDRYRAYEIPKSQIGFLQLVSLELYQELEKLEEIINSADDDVPPPKSSCASNTGKASSNNKVPSSGSIFAMGGTPNPVSGASRAAHTNSKYSSAAASNAPPGKRLLSQAATGQNSPAFGKSRVKKTVGKCSQTQHPDQTSDSNTKRSAKVKKETKRDQSSAPPSNMVHAPFTKLSDRGCKLRASAVRSSKTTPNENILESVINSTESSLHSARRGVTFLGNKFDESAVIDNGGNADDIEIPGNAGTYTSEVEDTTATGTKLINGAVQTRSKIKSSTAPAKPKQNERLQSLLTSVVTIPSHLDGIRDDAKLVEPSCGGEYSDDGDSSRPEKSGASSHNISNAENREASRENANFESCIASVDHFNRFSRVNSYGNMTEKPGGSSSLKDCCVEELLRNKRVWESYAVAFERLPESERSFDLVFKALNQFIRQGNN